MTGGHNVLLQPCTGDLIYDPFSTPSVMEVRRSDHHLLLVAGSVDRNNMAAFVATTLERTGFWLWTFYLIRLCEGSNDEPRERLLVGDASDRWSQVWQHGNTKHGQEWEHRK